MSVSKTISKQRVNRVKLIPAENYCLLAIYTTNSEARMAYLLNQSLHINLQRETGIHISNSFSIYSDRRAFKPVYFTLINNTPGVKEKLPAYHQADFFLKITDASQNDITAYCKNILKTEGTIACNILTMNTRQKKYFDLL